MPRFAHLLALATSMACAPAPAASPAAEPSPTAMGGDAGGAANTAQGDATTPPCTQADVGPLPAALDELSGLARSRRHADVLYAHNDSGDAPRFFALSARNAAKVATYTVQGARAEDWEDMATGPCTAQRAAHCVYLADIGDNPGTRSNVTIYELAEPALQDASLPAVAHTFRYPEGAQNAETLAVHPTSGEVFVLTKAFGTSRMYRISLHAAASQATLVQSLPVPGGMLALSTAGDFRSDGRAFAVRTYGALFEFAWPLTGSSPREIAVSNEPQGEAVTYGEAPGQFYSASEGNGQQLHLTRCTP